MWTFLERTDSAILNVCTKSSHKLQRATGLTNYFVAKVGIGVSCFGLTTRLVNYIHPFIDAKYGGKHGFTLIIDGLCFIIMADFVNDCIKAETSVDEIKPYFLLRYLLNSPRRIFWLSLSLFLILAGSKIWLSQLHPFLYMAYDSFLALGQAIFYYFMAVNPLPPSKSKVREWLESFGKVLKPATEVSH